MSENLSHKKSKITFAPINGRENDYRVSSKRNIDSENCQVDKNSFDDTQSEIDNSSAIYKNNITTHDVAKCAGVSQMTVSRVFSGKGAVAKQTVMLVKKAARELGYVPNFAARSMRTGSTQTVGVIAPNANVGMNSLRLESIENALLEHGYDAAITFTGGQTGRLLTALDKMLSRRVDGLIISHDHSLSSKEQSERILKKLHKLNVPYVISDAAKFAKEHNLPGVGIDRGSGMKDLVNHLKDLGKDDVWFWLPDITSSNHEKRIPFIKAANNIGLNLCEPDIDIYLRDFLRHNMDDSTYTDKKILSLNESQVRAWRKEERRVFRDSIRRMLSNEKYPSVIVTGSDHFAMVAIQELHAIDIKVPQTIAVVGYNDIFEAKLCSPPLTTVKQPHHQMAGKLVQILCACIDGNDISQQYIELPTSLIVRESTGGKDIQRKFNLNNDSEALAPAPSLSTVSGA